MPLGPGNPRMLSAGMRLSLLDPHSNTHSRLALRNRTLGLLENAICRPPMKPELGTSEERFLNKRWPLEPLASFCLPSTVGNGIDRNRPRLPHSGLLDMTEKTSTFLSHCYLNEFLHVKLNLSTVDSRSCPKRLDCCVSVIANVYFCKLL